MRVLDLFSGIGGFSLGLEAAGMETVAFCERDPFCQAVLHKHWPNTPIHSDITELDGYEYKGTVELVCGGFPCQPYSVAGQQRGAEDDRALWPEMLRVIREVQPTWVIGENVTGIIAMELDTVLSDLESEGYACQAFVIPACAVDAQHRRDRVWVVAYADSNSESNDSINEEQRPWELVADSISEPRGSGAVYRESSNERRGARQAGGESIQSKDRQSQSNNFTTSGENVADTESLRIERRQELRGSFKQPQRCFDDSKPEVWSAEPDVGRVADGVPNRTHRLKSLGNAVVPQVVEQIGKAIMGMRNPSHLRTTGVDGRGR
jgi:DNA (cytosine-5)-methyltransferase 1